MKPQISAAVVAEFNSDINNRENMDIFGAAISGC
jgi:hypothetical protein